MKKKKEKKIIENSFFDFISFIASFIVSFFRSFIFLFGGKKAKEKSYFFDFLDFSFRIWGKYFWKNPTWYKIGSFFGDITHFIFKKKD